MSWYSRESEQGLTVSVTIALDLWENYLIFLDLTLHRYKIEKMIIPHEFVMIA